MPYFPTEGPSNTGAIVSLALEAAAARGITHIVVATTSGATALHFKDAKVKVVAVSHAWGSKEKGVSGVSDETRKQLAEAGIPVHSASHALSGAERGLSSKFGGVLPVEIIAHTLRFFGAGTKVAVEVATSALDAGLIPHDVPVIAIGGSKSGADTALVLIPANTGRILETRIQEILAKPL